MNRNPTARMSQTGESLAHLAEIADVVSRQQQVAELARNVVLAPRPNPFGAVSAALRKRPSEAISLASQEGPGSSKRTKLEDSEGGLRFREYQAEIWSEKFEDLCEFRRYYGHCHVPHTYARNAPLAQWVKRQRYQYKLKAEEKRSTLSDERVRLLNKIGFIWNSHDAVWEERWNELRAYKRIHGNCIVPSNYEKNPQLAVWVKRQRRQYKFFCEGKPTSMTSERITKLEKLGFAWDCRKSKSDSEDEEPVHSDTPPALPQAVLISSLVAAARKPEPTPAETVTKQAKPDSPALPPCEFFSFSRTKFSKFPNIKLSKF
jgi:hypothetical protein